MSVNLSTAVITFKQKLDKWKHEGSDKKGFVITMALAVYLLIMQ